MDVPAAATDAARTGLPVIIRTPAEYEQRYPGPDTPAVAARGSSWLAWPLRADTAPVGAIGLMWRHPQQFEPGQLAFVAAVADLVAQAQVRARVYADEHALAAVLQRAIMPTTVAVIPGLEIGASYRQAGTTRQVGGDWHDAMALPGQRAYLAVGDVVGHGLAAAEDMTQLRNAGRTLAIAGYQPASILDELARVTDWATSGKFATAAAAIIEPDVSAGHLRQRGPPADPDPPRQDRDGGDPAAHRGASPVPPERPRLSAVHPGPNGFGCRRHHAHVHRRADRAARRRSRGRHSPCRRTIAGMATRRAARQLLRRTDRVPRRRAPARRHVRASRLPASRIATGPEAPGCLRLRLTEAVRPGVSCRPSRACGARPGGPGPRRRDHRAVRSWCRWPG